MLSLQFIRENADRVKRDVLLRNTTAPIDRILQLDEDRRGLLQQVEALRAEAKHGQQGDWRHRKTRPTANVRIAEMRLVGRRDRPRSTVA